MNDFAMLRIEAEKLNDRLIDLEKRDLAHTRAYAQLTKESDALHAAMNTITRWRNIVHGTV